MNNPPKTQSAGGIVINHRNQILMVQEYGVHWGFPRGHLEPGENELQAAIREIAEEAGVTNLHHIADLGFYERSTFDEDGRDNFREIKLMTFFMFYTDQIELNPKDSNITNVRWVYPEAVLSRLVHAEDRAFYLQSLPVVQKWLVERRA